MFFGSQAYGLEVFASIWAKPGLCLEGVMLVEWGVELMRHGSRADTWAELDSWR